MKPVTIITGPTGVGKTEFSLLLAEQLNGFIINADMGQLYTPLTIGTAKPAWQSLAIPHYGFDILDTPRHYSIIEYRTLVQSLIDHNPDAPPIIVGGSLFYLQSLFFLPPAHPQQGTISCQLPDDTTTWWHLLSAIDPVRAAKIHPHDLYRLERALTLWYSTGIKPSASALQDAPLGRPIILIEVTRERSSLYERINQRVDLMLQQGWLEEVKNLSPAWHAFLVEKKLIGYDDLIRWLQDPSVMSYDQVRQTIAQKTRHYAKRQHTFLRRLKSLIEQSHDHHTITVIKELNLTFSDLDLYIKQLLPLIQYYSDQR